MESSNTRVIETATAPSSTDHDGMAVASGAEPAEPTLKPCPFCGGEAAIGTKKFAESTLREQGWPNETRYFVNCIECGAQACGLITAETEDQAAEAWNIRAAQEPKPSSNPPAEQDRHTCDESCEKSMDELIEKLYRGEPQERKCEDCNYSAGLGSGRCWNTELLAGRAQAWMRRPGHPCEGGKLFKPRTKPQPEPREEQAEAEPLVRCPHRIDRPLVAGQLRCEMAEGHTGMHQAGAIGGTTKWASPLSTEPMGAPTTEGDDDGTDQDRNVGVLPQEELPNVRGGGGPRDGDKASDGVLSRATGTSGAEGCGTHGAGREPAEDSAGGRQLRRTGGVTDAGAKAQAEAPVPTLEDVHRALMEDGEDEVRPEGQVFLGYLAAQERRVAELEREHQAFAQDLGAMERTIYRDLKRRVEELERQMELTILADELDNIPVDTPEDSGEPPLDQERSCETCDKFRPQRPEWDELGPTCASNVRGMNGVYCEKGRTAAWPCGPGGKLWRRRDDTGKQQEQPRAAEGDDGKDHTNGDDGGVDLVGSRAAVPGGLTPPTPSPSTAMEPVAWRYRMDSDPEQAERWWLSGGKPEHAQIAALEPLYSAAQLEAATDAARKEAVDAERERLREEVKRLATWEITVNTGHLDYLGKMVKREFVLAAIDGPATEVGSDG